MKHAFLASSLLAVSLSSIAMENTPVSMPQETHGSSHHSWGFSLQTMSIDEKVAASNLIDDSMQSVNVYWQGKKSNLLVAAGIGLLMMDDNGSYDVDVMTYNGRRDSREAEAGGISFFIEGGYRHAIEKLNFDVLVGMEQIRADRSVDNCSNCPDEDIDIDAGLYFKPRIGYQFTDMFWMDLSYSSYVNGDISNNIGLAFTFKTQ
jgi:hypothetical protein